MGTRLTKVIKSVDTLTRQLQSSGVRELIKTVPAVIAANRKLKDAINFANDDNHTRAVATLRTAIAAFTKIADQLDRKKNARNARGLKGKSDE